MIFGKYHVTNQAVETHKDSYRIEHLTVISVRRPFLPFAVMMAAGGTTFTLRFADLLYPHEGPILIGAIAIVSLVGLLLGQLQLLSRDLRGSELTGAIWGTYGHFNHLRREIMSAALHHASAQVSS